MSALARRPGNLRGHVLLTVTTTAPEGRDTRHGRRPRGASTLVGLAVLLAAACDSTASGPAVTEGDAGSQAKDAANSHDAAGAGPADAVVRDSDGTSADDDGGAPASQCKPPVLEGKVWPHSIEIGVVDASGLGFAPLEPGGTIPIGGTGQAGLTAWMALRADNTLQRAIVELTLTNVETGEPAPSKPWGKPQDFSCTKEACVLAPVFVEISHLTKLPQLEGLCVTASAAVVDPDDQRVLARDATSGRFARQ